MLKNQNKARNSAEIEDIKNLIRSSLEETSAKEIEVISTEEMEAAIASYMIVATGRSGRNIGAISKEIIYRVKHDIGFVPRKSGSENSEWLVIDIEDVVVHLLTSDQRDSLQLEQLWSRDNYESRSSE